MDGVGCEDGYYSCLTHAVPSRTAHPSRSLHPGPFLKQTGCRASCSYPCGRGGALSDCSFLSQDLDSHKGPPLSFLLKPSSSPELTSCSSHTHHPVLNLGLHDTHELSFPRAPESGTPTLLQTIPGDSPVSCTRVSFSWWELVKSQMPSAHLQEFGSRKQNEMQRPSLPGSPTSRA